jgi:hypothetical protein
MMRNQNICVIDEINITHIVGDYKVDKIHFSKNFDSKGKADAVWSKIGSTDYFIKPDMMIVEDGVGVPKVDLR